MLLEQPQAERARADRRAHEKEQIRLLERQRLADHNRAGHAAPRQDHAEHDPDDSSSRAPAHVSAFVITVTTIAVAKNVPVAARLAGESDAVPLSPLPDVQPPATFAPKPISTPPPTRI